jgi:hypothetical protein
VGAAAPPPARRSRPDPVAGVGVLGRARRPYGERPPLAGRLAVRAAVGAAAGALVLAGLSLLGDSVPASPLTLAAAAGLATALLPRLGWLCSALALCGWLAGEGGRPGTALLVVVAAFAVAILLPRAGSLWSLAVLAPLLGTVALGPAFVALAGLAPTPWRRAGLAAAGCVWLLLAEALTGETLLFGPPDAVPASAEWEGSLTAAASDVLSPLVSSPLPAAAVAWAALAAVLPLLLRGRSLALDLVGGAIWAAGLMAALTAVGDLVAGTAVLDEARGAAAGALVGAVMAVAVSQTAPPSEGWRAQPVTTS